jgi:outer membrane protein
MKKLTFVALLSAGLLMSQAHAELLGAGVGAGIWQATPKGDTTLNNATLVDANNLKATSNNYFWAYINHPIPVIPNAMIEQTAFSSDKGSDSLTLDQLDTTLYWGLPLPMLDFNFGLTLKQFNGEVRNSLQTEKIDASVPMGYLALHVPIPATDFTISADTKMVSYDGSSLSDTRIKARWDLIGAGVNLGVEAGYRTQNVSIDGLDLDVQTDLTIDGLFAGVTLVF